jgi:type I restriction enzyme R subunit
MQDRLAKGRERLDDALEALALLCEPVLPPKGELEHIHFFCGNSEVPAELVEREPRRVALYKLTVTLLRSFAAIADELDAAGYGPSEVARIKDELQRRVDLREIIRKASNETIDLKAYEADMRHLIDTYIEADEHTVISPFGDMPLLELIAKSGISAAVANLPPGIKKDKNAVAETIANNVRSTIIKEHLNDPAFYDRMSALLQEILADLRAKRMDYAEYLQRIATLAAQVHRGVADNTPEVLKRSAGLRALFNNLQMPVAPPPQVEGVHEKGEAYRPASDPKLELALLIDKKVRDVRPDDWRGHQARENVIKRALLPLLGDPQEVERIFLIIKQQAEY